jgi:hypothetical protein
MELVTATKTPKKAHRSILEGIGDVLAGTGSSSSSTTARARRRRDAAGCFSFRTRKVPNTMKIKNMSHILTHETRKRGYESKNGPLELFLPPDTFLAFAAGGAALASPVSKSTNSGKSVGTPEAAAVVLAYAAAACGASSTKKKKKKKKIISKYHHTKQTS